MRDYIDSRTSDTPSNLEQQIANNRLLRFGIATAQGAVSGSLSAIVDDAQQPGATATKALSACAMGAAMRIALPESGAAKLLVSTTLGFYASQDLINPFINAYRQIHRAQTLGCVIQSGNKLGRSLGHFAVDSVIGLTAGGKSEKLTEDALVAGFGHKNYLNFEYGKQELWKNCLPAHLYPESILRQLSYCFSKPTLEERLSRIHLELPVKTVRTASLLNEFSAANMSALAAIVKKQVDAWTGTEIQLADIKEHLEAPIFSVSDCTRHGALLQRKFLRSSKQMYNLIAGIKNESDLDDLGSILKFHATSALQDELGLKNVSRLNLFAEELHAMFVNGIKKAGISSQILSGSVPSRVAVTGDYNFTIPPMPGVIDRPVTVFPRNQTTLESVLAGINRHEMSGHDYTWGEMREFPAELRNVILPQALKAAMQAAKIEDTEVPGLSTMKKSEFFLKVLQAQAEENISDLVGTASGGSDYALCLGLLLQSRRCDGKLETGSFFGPRFNEYVECHGIDRCRIKWCAEQMRQLASHDPVVLQHAHALDIYAANASRPGRYYTWANEHGQVAVPIKEWDALIPHVIKAQLDTPLQSLEGKRLKDILPDMSKAVERIEALAVMMERDLNSNQDILVSIFDHGRYAMGEVYAAGLRTWMHATAKGADPEKSLAKISRLSGRLCNLYLGKQVQ